MAGCHRLFPMPLTEKAQYRHQRQKSLLPFSGQPASARLSFHSGGWDILCCFGLGRASLLPVSYVSLFCYALDIFVYIAANRRVDVVFLDFLVYLKSLACLTLALKENASLEQELWSE